MKLEGHLSIEVESSSKAKKHEKPDKNLQLLSPEELNDERESSSKDLGSTALRKTIFKKHYTDRMKEIGEEPSISKGVTSNINKIGNK